MRPERRQKQELLLQLKESELRTLLQRLLPSVAENGSPIFMNSQFNPHGLLAAHLPEESEPLLEAANGCVELRQQLGLAVDGSVGELFLAACRESAALHDEHRRGPRKLALWLLGELSGNA
jgi:hypothetical protein